MKIKLCPNCGSDRNIKSGIVNDRQRYKCKECGYFFTVNKIGKKIDDYYVNKSLQLYLEGLTYREIERILGISHVSIMNWVKKYNIKRPYNSNYHPTYKILNALELGKYFANAENIKGAGVVVTELGDKFMLIKWERFKD
ncbi:MULTISPECIES: helix-turn-helix domain-containing protein [unclassified Algibacter]|uniref:IS1/IS1595 family N-terminal zinc-binding domain-containing protein n=1 Tax=unclassified Algibacter TaxID=2615009 RepID=UPI00131B46CF|nr:MULTISPECIES: helix-turn-helix domain-containing protein [unclassified Algibacter]MCL5129887.1 helix-turn-helix domain-containing protein [Algibacter sp. L4_22]